MIFSILVPTTDVNSALIVLPVAIIAAERCCKQEKDVPTYIGLD